MRMLTWLLGTIVALATLGAVYQIAGMVLDRQHYPPPGQLVDIGGHRLHLFCLGTGSPTVLLEAPAPGWSLYWSTVQPQLARTTRVCAYDRAGLGWSERGPLPRTGQRMAKELHRLLERAGIRGPYILVGHSLGGLIARLYQHDYPQEVVGMVLVDAGHESEMRQAEFRLFANAGKSMLPVIRALTMVGITRLMASYDQLPPLLMRQEEKVSAETRPMLRAGWLRTGYYSTLTDESDGLIETLEQVRRSGSLGNLPLIVITATGPVWWPDMPGQVNQAKFRKMWLELQQGLTTLSTNSRQVFADQSSHFIPFDQPELLTDVVRQLIDRQRSAPYRP
ncbi:MAG: alpha/beta hydrolase [Nitrospira sp.]|nr:alpha/beta hydrolase [Nitrospira sp.]MBX7039278.1 alpha/beta hydrolase [Nitrospira sp.]HMW85755.1 alpha/beta hydrolase [Nitrospira sp.]HNA85969.1 alpha/beta hydrolase [Nitrospira sp.]